MFVERSVRGWVAVVVESIADGSLLRLAYLSEKLSLLWFEVDVRLKQDVSRQVW